jgi:Xaa-Pro dipeptidase
MAQRGLDVLLLFSPVSAHYLTGYLSMSSGTFLCLIVPLQGEPTLLVWASELPLAYLTSWITDGIGYEYGEDPIAIIRDALDQRGLLGGTIGLEKDPSPLGARDYERLTEALAGRTLADGTGIIKRLLGIKSRQEIQYIRQAGVISARGMQAAVEATAEGATDNQVAAAASQAMLAAGSGFPSLATVVTTGRRSGIPHTTHRRLTIRRGDPVWIELGACYERYSAPLMRTVFVGSPPAGAQQLADASLACLHTVLATMRPGIPAEEVAIAGAHELPLDDPEVVFHNTYGYSIGLGFPPSWADDGSLLVMKGNRTLLQPGMVFHVTMGLRRNGQYGAVTSETVAITEAGCEALTDFARQTFYK